jgi:membrane protein
VRATGRAGAFRVPFSYTGHTLSVTVTPGPVSQPTAALPAARRAVERAFDGRRKASATVREAAVPIARRRPIRLVRRTFSKAWHDRVLGLSAEAAFWQLLSLPPLFLALLGSFGYLAGPLGADTINAVEQKLLDAFSRAFTPAVVDQLIQPIVSEVLHGGRADVVSIGTVLALWAGSSATSTFVNTVTIAYGMRDLRGAVRSRLLALWIYLGTVVIGVGLLPVLVLGPTALVRLMPDSVESDAARLINAVYWPAVGGILLIGLTTFYHLAPPKRLPWHRGVPGAALAMAVFLLGSLGLRAYIRFAVGQGLTYGTLAAPIAALLFFFLLALAVLTGAELNAAIEHLSPSQPGRRAQRRAEDSQRTTPEQPPVGAPAPTRPRAPTEATAEPERAAS